MDLRQEIDEDGKVMIDTETPKCKESLEVYIDIELAKVLMSSLPAGQLPNSGAIVMVAIRIA